jgi:hypothetical protein
MFVRKMNTVRSNEESAYECPSNCSLPVEYAVYVAPCTLNKCTFFMSFIELYRYKTAVWSIICSLQFMFVVLFTLEKKYCKTSLRELTGDFHVRVSNFSKTSTSTAFN